MIRKNILLVAVVLTIGLFNYSLSMAKDKEKDTDQKSLAGTTWTIENKTLDPSYTGTTGKVTFSADNLTIDFGRFAAAGIVAALEDSFCLLPLDPISYELIGDSLIRITWTGQARPGLIVADPELLKQESILTIDSRDRKKVIVAGEGGCGGTGAPRISILTRVHEGR